MERSENFSDSDFNNALRRTIIVLLTFIILVFISSYVINYYISSGKPKSKVKRAFKYQRLFKYDEGEQEKERDLKPVLEQNMIIFACSFALSFIVCLMFVFPVTIIVKEAMDSKLTENTYLGWLTADLIDSFWNYIFSGSLIAFFIVLPVSFFYDEANDSDEPTTSNSQSVRKWVSKLSEAVFIWCIICLLFISLLYILHGFIGIPWSFLSAWISLIMSLVVVNMFLSILSIPKGVLALFRYALSFAVAPKYKDKLYSRILELELEENVILSRLDSVDTKVAVSDSYVDSNSSIDSIRRLSEASTIKHRLSSKEYREDLQKDAIDRTKSRRLDGSSRKRTRSFTDIAGVSILTRQLNDMRTEREELQKKYKGARPLLNNLIFISILVISFVLMFVYVAWLFWKLVHKSIGYISMNDRLKNILHYIDRFIDVNSIFPRQTIVLAELGSITFFTLAHFLGLYEFKFMKRIVPLIHETTIPMLIMNLFLVGASSLGLPVLIRLQGLTNIDTQGYFTFEYFEKNVLISIAYQAMLLLVLVYHIMFSFQAFILKMTSDLL
jgi:flagellar basal body-associated protein FliL